MSVEYQTDTATNADNSKIFHAATANQSDGPFYCQYCGEKLKLSKNINPDARPFRPHFKHREEDVNNPRRCIYTNSDLRHKLATMVLLESKKIKVPAIGKPNPENPDDPWMLIREAYFIESADVRKEVAIYEDEFGDMHYGEQTSHEKMNLFVRPDVVFFDSDGAPLLFVELVHTHKPDKQKVEKFNRIGIDTVQVKIPHTSKEDIEKCFNRSTNVKWVYNHEQANAVYRTPDGKESIELPNVDQDQRKLLEETQACRQARIRNLIRGIKRCLQSEQYRDIESQLESEVRRVKDNTERNKRELSELETGVRAEFKGYEEKYRQEVERNYRDTREKLGKSIKSEEAAIKDLSGKTEDVEQEIERLRGEIERIEEEIEESGRSQSDIISEEERIERETRGVEEEIGDLDGKISAFEWDKRQYIELEGKEQKLGVQLKERFKTEEEQFKESIRADEEDYDVELRGEVDNIIKRISEGDYKVTDPFRDTIRRFSGAVTDTERLCTLYKRNEKAKVKVSNDDGR